MLFGNNEDWNNPNTYIWFELPTEGKFGGIYFGFDDYFSQGGMNEKGLCFDANALPQMALTYHPELLSSQGWIVKHLIDVCENVSQLISLAQDYNWDSSMAYQVHFADASGDAVVISPGSTGELNFTRKNAGDGYLVSTNFNVGYPTNGWTPCWRYPLATRMLEKIDHEDNLTVDSFCDILDATHQEGTYATRYSNIFDLRSREIYIYQDYSFHDVIKLNLDEELAKGSEKYLLISDLFSNATPQVTQESPFLILFSSLLFLVIIRKKIARI